MEEISLVEGAKRLADCVPHLGLHGLRLIDAMMTLKYIGNLD